MGLSWESVAVRVGWGWESVAVRVGAGRVVLGEWGSESGAGRVVGMAEWDWESGDGRVGL